MWGTWVDLCSNGPGTVLDWGQGAKADPESRIRGPVVYLGGSPSKTQSRAETWGGEGPKPVKGVFMHRLQQPGS